MTAPAVSDSFVFPASLAQQRLWFLADSDPTAVAYNVAKATLIHGALDVDALRKAIALVVERHEALRTRFDRIDDCLVQVLSAGSQVHLAIEEVDDAPNADPSSIVDQLVRDEARAPFDLRRGPLVRARLYRLGSDQFLLCLTLHHIICDAWSLGLLHREVTSAYAGFARGDQPDLGPLPLQYADFAVWEQQQDARGEDARAFWRRELADLPATINWPADYARPPTPTWQGDQVTIALADDAVHAVRRLAHDERTTPAVVLLTAFAVFLHRWTGDCDIPIGTPVAGRDRVELEAVVGCFVNTVITRFRVDPTMRFRQLLTIGRGIMLEALRHQAASFESVVQAVRRSAANGSSPLFQAMFTLHSVSDDREPIGSLEFTPVQALTGTSKCDVTMVAVEGRASLKVRLEFSRDLFDVRTMSAAADAFRTLLAAALESSDATVADLPFAPTDRSSTFQGTITPYPRGTDVHTLFATTARARGSAVAIDTGSHLITYAELHRQADAITAALQNAGVNAGQFVGLLADRGASMIAAMIGIVGAGAAYVPIDPGDPPARIAAVVEDAGIGIVLTAPSAERRLQSDVRTLDIDQLLRASPAREPMPVHVGGDAPAYMMYTSGSTGLPKGVVVPHRAIARLVLATDYVQIESGDRVAQASNAAFDAATFEIWGALLNGATLAVVATDVVTSPARLARELRQRKITILFVTTAVFNRVAVDVPAAFHPLRALLFGGEASSPHALSSVLAAGGPSALIHVYGPTECTTFATAHHVAEVGTRAATVPIGLPIANTAACIVDDRSRAVAHGVVGELCLAGDGLAIGYHRLPDLTAERFVMHRGVRWYRTGDRCRVNASGAIEFVARADRQLKIRGFRIEPAEVELALSAHAAVGGAVVDVTGDGDERRLVACVTARPGHSADPDELRQFLSERVPRFAIPSSIAIVTELPLTANGKIDRPKLLGAVAATTDERRALPPRDPLEAELVRIWEELLQVSPIGVTDDFFLLGGHSLLGAAMIDRIEKLFGRRVPVSALLQHPTIEGLAGALWQAQCSGSGPLTVLRQTGTRPPFFFLHGDLNGAGLYCARLAQQLHVDQPVYTLAPLGLDGGPTPPSIEAMATAYIDMIRRCRQAGPIAIGGYCHGGLIAFEIARRLSRERRITNIIMIHPPAVEPRLAPLDTAIRAMCHLLRCDEQGRISLTLRIADAVHVLLRLRGRGAGRFVMAKLATLLGWRSQPNADSPAVVAESVTRHDPRTWASYLRAVAAYVPRRYDGDVCLLIPEMRTGSGTRGWRHAARVAYVVDIAGDHRGCITTHVESLGRAIDRELLRCAPMSNSSAVAAVVERHDLV